MEYIKATEKDLEHIVTLVQETIKTIFFAGKSFV